MGLQNPPNPAAPGSHLHPHDNTMITSLSQTAGSTAFTASAAPTPCPVSIPHFLFTPPPGDEGAKASGRVGTCAGLSRTLAGDPEWGAFPYADLRGGWRSPCFPIVPMAPASSSRDDDPRVTLHLALAKATPYACSCRPSLAILLSLHRGLTLRPSILTTGHVWPPSGLCSAQHPSLVEPPVAGTSDQYWRPPHAQHIQGRRCV